MPRHKIDAFCESVRWSPREREIFKLMLLSLTQAQDIGGYLQVSPHTVHNHMKKMLAKARAETKAELLAQFVQHCFRAEA